MPTFIQGAQGNQINSTGSGTPASAVFASANTLHNLIAVAVLFFPRTLTGSGYTGPSLTVSDTAGNSYVLGFAETYPSGGVTVAHYFCLSCLGSANTVKVSSTNTGAALFIDVHEVQADSGQVWKFNGCGSGQTTTTGDLSTSGPVVEGQYNSSNTYCFASIGFDSDNQHATVFASTTAWNSRQFNSNSTAIDTGATTTGGAELYFYGALSTYDALNTANVSWEWLADGRTIYTAIGIISYFASLIPSCDPPVATPTPGSYTGTQTVTLSQDQAFSMYYTLDGSTPTTASTHYTTAITVSANEQINVLVYDSSLVNAATVTALIYTILPPLPANANIAISWIRRTRVGGAWLDGTGTVPLSEESESYDLFIYDDTGTTVVRSALGLTSPSFNYTSAMQFSDFGIYKPYVYVKVFQNSAAMGHGFPAINPTCGKF